MLNVIGWVFSTYVCIQQILDVTQGLLSVMAWCSDFASSPLTPHNLPEFFSFYVYYQDLLIFINEC